MGGKGAGTRRLFLALAVGSVIFLLEIAGGIISNSLALLSDAGHILVDIFAISLTIVAARVGERPHTPILSYGYHRTEVLSSFVNGLVLIGMSGYIFLEGYRRIVSPPQVDVSTLLLVASIGLVGNLLMMALLRGAGISRLHIKGAYLHVMGDTLLSIGVIIGGLVVLFTNFVLIDSIIAAAIGIVIMITGVGLVRESGSILMERVPRGLEPADITRAILEIEGIKGIHELHVWTVTSGFHALSGHLIVEDQKISEASKLLKEIDKALKNRFGISHTTIQLENETFVTMKKQEDDRI
jgi:cobalt-zinc-cadmium efflux system protein